MNEKLNVELLTTNIQNYHIKLALLAVVTH